MSWRISKLYSKWLITSTRPKLPDSKLALKVNSGLVSCRLFVALALLDEALGLKEELKAWILGELLGELLLIGVSDNEGKEFFEDSEVGRNGWWLSTLTVEKELVLRDDDERDMIFCFG